MPHVLVIDNDDATRTAIQAALASTRHRVRVAHTGRDGVESIDVSTPPLLIVCEMSLSDMSGMDVLREVHRRGDPIPVLFVARRPSTRDIVDAIRGGALNCLEKPLEPNDIATELQVVLRAPACRATVETSEPHATARWARALVPVIDSPRDPRTITSWSRWVAASAGALRNWCRTAGIPPRRSLIFIRLLRAVVHAESGGHKLPELLDVVDRRTLTGLLSVAGFHDERDLPRSVDEYLRRQQVVTDATAIAEVRRVLEERRYQAVRIMARVS